MKNPILITSLDFELFWGMQDGWKLEDYQENILGGRKAIPKLLNLFQKHGIHSTWAAVGFMFAENLEDVQKYFPEKSMLPSYDDEKLSSYRCFSEIGKNEEEAPCFYAPSLIKQVSGTEGQEIGTHTFSHYYCRESGQTIEQFEADMKAAVIIAQDKGYAVESLVLPRNQCDPEYTKVYSKLGIKAYRDEESDWIHEKVKFRPLMRLLRFMDVYFPLTGQGGYIPKKEYGVWNFTGSRMYKPYFKPLAFLEGMKVRRIKKQMLHAAKNNLVFHLWWHPHNIGVRTDYHLKQLEDIFSYYDKLKEKYGMQSMNMKEATEYFSKETQGDIRMYQFYYADGTKITKQPRYDKNVSNEYEITAVRPTMWEEHCLECSAPACFGNCVHYIPRSDGRCMRFDNGIYVYPNEKGCCGQGARVKFRKWANMMTVIYPAMLDKAEYKALTDKNQKLGKKLQGIADSKMPVKVKWESIRTTEFLRRRKLRGLTGLDNQLDAFIFHGYSFEQQTFNLILEIYDDHTPVFKTALGLEPGENLMILDDTKLSKACSTPNYLVKLYPENDLEAELDILWCDFVKGHRIVSDQPASKVKCVVWDLDNTVWNGTLIETENPDDLQMNSGIADLMKALDERGIIQSIASKNDYDAAWSIVKKLGLADYFIYPQIHWNAKSGSMEQIAKSLNIGIDTFALIDDSVFERNQVQSALPQVRVYDVTDIPTLLDRDEFYVIITDESKNRRAMYKAEEKRNELMQSADNGDTVEFLKKCHLSIELFEPQTEDEKLRCYELLVRTNQLNLSGKKYTSEEYEDVLKRENHTNFAFSCKDDFGSYGIVGFGQYKIENDQLVFTEFAMSCRVAGKYVESALFSGLLEKEHCNSGEFTVHKTKKNMLLRNTLQSIGFDITGESDGRISYDFGSELLNKELVSVNWR